MKPAPRKAVLTTHISSSVGWFGAVVGFLALALTAANSKEILMVRAAYLSMAAISRFVIVPLAFAALLSGFVQALATPWGLFRHSWIVVKLAFTIFATAVLLLKMPLIVHAARLAMVSAAMSALDQADRELIVHSAGGAFLLFVITIVSVFKPWGLTQYGRRKLSEKTVHVAE